MTLYFQLEFESINPQLWAKIPWLNLIFFQTYRVRHDVTVVCVQLSAIFLFWWYSQIWLKGLQYFRMLCCNLQASDCWLILFRSICRVFAAITFGSMAVGRSSTQLPDYTKAKLAASNIKKLLARESAIDPMSTDGETPVSWSALVRANSFVIKNNLLEKNNSWCKNVWPKNHRRYRSRNVFKGI